MLKTKGECMKIDTIKNYLLNTNDFDWIIDEIYELTRNLGKIYPRYKEWFFEKQVKGCFTPERNILFMQNDEEEIIGIVSVKKNFDEQKICTLYVKENYRNKKTGERLVEMAIEFLDNKTPLVTFSEDTHDFYKRIIKKYNWQLTQILDSKYQLGKKEYCYNGYLK